MNKYQINEGFVYLEWTIFGFLWSFYMSEGGVLVFLKIFKFIYKKRGDPYSPNGSEPIPRPVSYTHLRAHET